MPLPPLVHPVDALSDDERARTQRHAALRGFGEAGQRHLAAAHVAIIGAGGLGSPAVLALCAAGVGTLTVIDDDDVDLTNLQRQVLHRLGDVGAPKVDSAVRAAADLSPETRVVAVHERLDAANAVALLADADLVLDGSDTFATRTIVAAECERRGIPLVWGVVQEFHAQVTVFWSAPPQGREPVVLADLHPTDRVGQTPSCADVGVLGALTLQVGSVMAVEAIKLIAGIGEPLLGRVLVIDALQGRFTEVPLHPTSESTTESSTADPAARDGRDGSAHPHPVSPSASTSSIAGTGGAPAIAHVTAAEMLAAKDEENAVLLDVREPWETQSGVVADSVLIPLGDFLADPAQLDADGPVVVICAHGMRAQQAAEVLHARGVDARVLVGGLAAWT
ncbi:ThiF family adenylyltransferase [Microbacterium dextranolyticum]|uniref:Adenylyltransferase/sulfurtransferase MoeZ n=1 Tax=Microbacterium dextranolyticum TaxID=36806 RepID=A0A9W6HLB1_9MICO|nr:ThiF family adenylyltransferase [Microbacterium dextranolyticum]MBM7462257.1 adenylyltransferase/sulfurtransferase [Microbacterium dextranolyticum]GLJ94509.1 adenylyltransferase/sulfurtransferase MoeZ [Microbacterium dextranolyticum]